MAACSGVSGSLCDPAPASRGEKGSDRWRRAISISAALCVQSACEKTDARGEIEAREKRQEKRQETRQEATAQREKRGARREEQAAREEEKRDARAVWPQHRTPLC